MTTVDPSADPFAARLAHRAEGLLAAFNAAGVLDAADVHVARRLGALGGEEDETVLLACALAVRGPRVGHVLTDLATIAVTAAVETDVPVDLAALDWPDAGAWVAAVAASPLAAVGDEEEPGEDARPLRLVGTHVYLDRYWREERRVADDLLALAAAVPAHVDGSAVDATLDRLFPGEEREGRQAAAARTAVERRLAVIAGGPGTGKTTTVGRIVALLHEEAAARGADAPLVALAAPTGKAAARLGEAVGQPASTLHRLLGWKPRSHSRFRHDRDNRLPHDVVIVDETSMISLSLMARLVEAIRPDARLVLVGDPDQLTSIEAGAVLGDVVGPAREAGGGAGGDPAAQGRIERALDSPPIRGSIERALDSPPRGGGAAGPDPSATGPLAPHVVVLDRVHRYAEGGAIAELAGAIRTGDADAALDVLGRGTDDVTWLDADAGAAPLESLHVVRDAAVEAGARLVACAREGDAAGALDALGAFRLLCAHRRGPHGARHWIRVVERWLQDAVESFDPSAEWHAGRPLLVTENDPSLRLFNGDAGVVITTGDGRLAAAFERDGEIVTLAPSRLAAVDTVHAMTIHKSQGSQFRTAAVILPPPESPILTRELLYTAATRARERLVVMGTEASLRAALARPAARASGLRERLWSAPMG